MTTFQRRRAILGKQHLLSRHEPKQNRDADLGDAVRRMKHHRGCRKDLVDIGQVGSARAVAGRARHRHRLSLKEQLRNEASCTRCWKFFESMTRSLFIVAGLSAGITFPACRCFSGRTGRP